MSRIPPEIRHVFERAVAREKDSPPRRHHYVPRFYLARFSDQKGRLSAYDRTTKKLISRRPEELGVERDFYRLPDSSGLPRYFLEELLSLQEGEAKSAIETAVQAGKVDDDARPTLATHLAMQILRSPQTRAAVGESTEWSGSIMAQIELGRKLQTAELSDEDRRLAEQAIEDLEAGKLRVGPAKDARVALALVTFEALLDELLGDWAWVIVVASRAGFITTDQPVALLGEPEPGSPATNLGVATALEVWFPLDSRHALVLTRDRSLTSPLIGLAHGHIRLINLRLALESARWIFFRPSTDPLHGIQIPTDPPKWFARTVGHRPLANGGVGELIQTGVSRPHVPHERLLSGRQLRPFPKTP